MLSLSTELFESFMRTVVIAGAFSDAERTRSEGPLPEKSAKEIQAGKRIDPRIPYLCRISGKGGYSKGADAAKRNIFRNISLLDHLVSVARGGCVFAELDLRACNVEQAQLRPRLARLLAVGFLHDADKILDKSRVDELTADDIAGLLSRYQLDVFLREAGVTPAPADLLSMIHEVEVSRAGSLRPGMRLLSPEEIGDCLYVRLADRLDGLFLNTEKGPKAVIEQLKTFNGFRSASFIKSWRVVEIRSAHTPFLLNALQRGLSASVNTLLHMPPLIEMHHDGELVAIIPEHIADQAIDKAITRAMRALQLPMRVTTNPRGTRNILDGGSSLEDLQEVLDKDPAEASRALFISIDYVQGSQPLREEIDRLLSPLGMAPDYAGLAKFAGKHYQAWPYRADEEATRSAVRRDAAAIAIALGCEEPKEKTLAAQVPDAAQREAELLAALRAADKEIPEWLLNMEHKLSRQSLLAVLAASLSEQDDTLRAQIFGFDDGLLHTWLCGDGDARMGLLAKLGDPSAVLIDAAKSWLNSALHGRFFAADEHAPGRCHFTNIPVGLAQRIDSKSGLDGVNVSAFSGREGRPESFDSAKAQTLVSAPAAAEHRLRTLLGEGRSNDVPAYVSSPTAMGLFASLHMQADADFLQLDQYDMARLEPKANRPVWPQAQVYGQRLIFGRHVAVPNKTIEVIKLTRMMMEAALRLSRPVHVFKGLPVRENAYVHVDFLPETIARGIGGNALRLEQIPQAIEQLQMIEQLAEATNIGLELALRYADPATRFGAACEALAVLNRMSEDQQKRLQHLTFTLKTLTRSPDIPMTEHDNVLIEFARAMSRVQAAPARTASNSERTLGIKIALTAIESCVSTLKQSGHETLIAAIAGSLENEFERSARLAWRGKDRGLAFPRKAAMEAATVFVERVWPIAFQGRPPASKARRIAVAIYQVAFETESYRKREQTDNATPENHATHP